MKRATFRIAMKSANGKGVSRKLRAAGRIPAVIYGPEQEAVPLWLDDAWLRQALKEGSRYSLFKLIVDGDDPKKLDGKLAFIKDVQYHPFKTKVIHMDLYQVGLHQEITMSIPLRFSGEPSISGKDFVVQELMRELTVRCEAKDLPEFLDVSIEGFKPNDKISVKDIVLPAGLQVMQDLDEPVVIMTGKTMEFEAAVTESDTAEGQDAE
ncbi:50S ribosomal protein L25 [bacterium]|nr:50S ribosomal protein L25 [candidate division CSSED10-310 bacterium]